MRKSILYNVEIANQLLKLSNARVVALESENKMLLQLANAIANGDGDAQTMAQQTIEQLRTRPSLQATK